MTVVYHSQNTDENQTKLFSPQKYRKHLELTQPWLQKKKTYWKRFIVMMRNFHTFIKLQNLFIQFFGVCVCVWNAYKNTQCSVLSLVTVHLRMVNKLHFVHCAIGAEKWEQIGPEKIYSNLFIYSSMCRPPSSSRISILRFYFRLLFTLSTTRCGFILFYALANVTTVNKTEIYAFNSEINGHNFVNEREIRSIQNALHISIHSIEFFVA